MMGIVYLLVQLMMIKSLECIIVNVTFEEQHRALIQERASCEHRMQTEESKVTGHHCSRVWDSIMCWSDTPAGTVVRQPCPDYINGLDTEEFAFRTCLPNGTWYVPSHLSHIGFKKGWTNFTLCIPPFEWD